MGYGGVIKKRDYSERNMKGNHKSLHSASIKKQKLDQDELYIVKTSEIHNDKNLEESKESSFSGKY